ncbi:MAG: hypothetical protein J7K83_03355 [Candidatus Aenigmarchaeota archaeon]|nr:hypothetical protein [Candidatus Aenigmarchaeota archaeon]
MKGQKTLDEFAFILLGSVIFIMVLAIYFTQQEVTTPEKITNKTDISEKLSKFSVFIAAQVNISLSNETKTIDEVNSVSVEKGYFSEKSISLILPDKTNQTKEVMLEFLVRDTNNAGNLEIYVNDVKLWSKRAEPGIYTIKIPLSYLKQESNYVKIKATNPGWKFWMRAVYLLDYAKTITTTTETEEEEFSFYVDKNILEKSELAELSFKKFPSLETSNLVIEINDKIIYNKRPFSRTNEIEIDKSVIKAGDNTIEFYVNGEAFYDIRDVKLFLYYRE